MSMNLTQCTHLFTVVIFYCQGVLEVMFDLFRNYRAQKECLMVLQFRKFISTSRWNVVFLVNSVSNIFLYTYQFLTRSYYDNQNSYCPNVSTTPITAMGCWQCLPLSVVQQKGKHCRKPHCPNGVVETFGHFLPMKTWKNKEFIISQKAHFWKKI